MMASYTTKLRLVNYIQNIRRLLFCRNDESDMYYHMELVVGLA